MSKTIEIPDIALWEENDSELAKYTIGKLEKENKELKEIVYNLTTMTANGDRTQIKNTAQYKLEQCQQKINKALEEIDNYIRLCAEPDLNYLEDILKEENISRECQNCERGYEGGSVCPFCHSDDTI